jgi:hypothetical protein
MTHSTPATQSAPTSTTNRILAAQLFWEVSLHMRGFVPRGRARPMSVEQALKKLNTAMDLTHASCKVYWKAADLMATIIEGKEEQTSSAT